MSCPFKQKQKSSNPSGGLLYGEYLMLDRLLSAQRMLSVDNDGKHPACDEHLFIIIHQTYELWFKEILFELDIVKGEFSKETLHTAAVVKRLNRIVMILKLLVDQVLILETMAPTDFNDFRKHLDTASGFQSLQFRLIENILGVHNAHRNVEFHQNYSNAFKKDDLNNSSCASLLQLVEKWLESTPHLDILWRHYKHVVETHILQGIDDRSMPRESLKTPGNDDTNESMHKKIREQFATIFDGNTHEALIKRGERKISLNALQAAIITTLYKDDAMFCTAHQLLTLLVDVDSMLSRWRYNHVLLVQRMIGSMQIGTGGSSGYQYLRSTLSDRYKPFVDIANLTTFLINKEDLLPLSQLLPTTLNLAENSQSEDAPHETHHCRHRKGKKSSCRPDTNGNDNDNSSANGKRSFTGRPVHKDCGKQRCLLHANTKGNFAANCNVRVEFDAKASHNRMPMDFQHLTVHSASEEEKKERESSYESTSSSSSTSIH